MRLSLAEMAGSILGPVSQSLDRPKYRLGVATLVLGLSLGIGLTAMFAPLALIGLLVVVVLVLLAARGGSVPAAIILAWLAVVGAGVDSGLKVAGATTPVAYLLVVSLAAVSAVRLAVRLRRGTSERILIAILRLQIVVVIPLLTLVIAGLLARNAPDGIRQEASLWLVMALTAAMMMATFEPEHIRGLAIALVAAGALAAMKTLLIAGSGTITSGYPDSLQANSGINPQFGVQRVILFGGDTLMALGVPAAVALLRSARGPAIIPLIGAVAVTFLGVTLTYTRTLVGAVAVGVLVALSLPVARGASRWVSKLQLLAGAAVGISALDFTIGSSRVSSGEALLNRFTGGSAAGSSDLSARLADAWAALGQGDSHIILLGGGLGASFHSPITPELSATTYVHMGYPWLILNGGIPLLILTVGALLWAIGILVRTARRLRPEHTAGAAGLAASIGAFAAINLLVNRFDSIEGAIFLGIALGVASILTPLTRRDSANPEPAARTSLS